MEPISKIYDKRYFQPALNLGCGSETYNNFDNVDKYKVNDKIIDCDLFKRDWSLNFESDYYRFIYSNHFFEHIPDTQSFINLMHGIFNVAKDTCILEIRTPYPYLKMLKDLDHYRLIDVSTFKRFMNAETNSLTACGNMFKGSVKLIKRIPQGYTRFNLPPYWSLHLIFRIEKGY